MEAMTDFIFLGFKNTVDDDDSHEIERCLLFGRKAMTNQDNIKKKKKTGITLPTKVWVVKEMVFQIVIYGCKSWTIKKTEHRRADV